MTVYEFVHPGRPKTKERPRSGRGSRVYTPKSTMDAQRWLAESYAGPFFEGPLGVDLSFHPNKTVVRLYDWTHGVSPLKGDIDNYEKLVEDALQGVAYPNDRMIMHVEATKVAA